MLDLPNLPLLFVVVTEIGGTTVAFTTGRGVSFLVFGPLGPGFVEATERSERPIAVHHDDELGDLCRRPVRHR